MAQSPKTKPPATSKKAGEHFTKKTKKKRVFSSFFFLRKKKGRYIVICVPGAAIQPLSFGRVFRNPPVKPGSTFPPAKTQGKTPWWVRNFQVISLTTLLQARQEERAWDPWWFTPLDRKFVIRKKRKKKRGI